MRYLQIYVRELKNDLWKLWMLKSKSQAPINYNYLFTKFIDKGFHQYHNQTFVEITWSNSADKFLLQSGPAHDHWRNDWGFMDATF